MKQSCLALGMAAIPLAAAGALAQVHAGDVILRVESGAIVTGRLEGGAPVFPRRVIGGTFGDTGVPGATFNPGYDSENGVFGPAQPVGLTIRRALRKWNGSDFSTIPPERLSIIKNSTILTPAQDPPACGVGDSLALGVANSSGRLHQHPAYQLGEPTSPGIYAVEVQLWMGLPGGGTSPPLWLLFNQNESASVFADAFAWAEANLAGAAGCYANCDGSTAAPVLNVNDFVCFQSRFAAGSCQANCDSSTTAPVLNVNDFICFQQKFAAGCP